MNGKDAPKKDELLEAIYAGLAPDHAEPPKREFLPWHKPRKHWVRIHQWCRQVQKLMKDIEFRDERPLRYLSLPGEDLLDVRVLHGVCERQGVRLKFLGLDSTRTTELNISDHEVASLSHIDKQSSVKNDRLEHLVEPRSLACESARRYGPFDVVNLDLCNSIAHKKPAVIRSNLNAIRSLIDLQLRRKTDPWLLFVTTLAGKDEVNTETMQTLGGCVMDNIVSDAEFANRFADRLCLDGDLIRAGLDGTDELCDSQFVNVFGVGFGKWLLKLALSGSPHWTVTMQESCCYRMYGDHPDMLSFSFRFDLSYQPRVDATGATPQNDVEKVVPNEVVLAANLVDGVSSLIDLDKLLEGDEELRRKMINKSADLLESARYSREAYLEWLSEAS